MGHPLNISMHKKIVLGIAIALVCILLGGIAYHETHLSYDEYVVQGQKKADTQETEEESTLVFPKNYQEEVTAYLNFDAEVVTSPEFDPNEIYDTTATLKDNDGPTMRDKLMKKSGDIVTEEFDDTDREGNAVTGYTFTEDEDYLLVRPNYIGYTEGDLLYAFYEVFFFYEVAPYDNRAEFFEAADLADFSRTDAWEYVEMALGDEVPGLDSFFSFCAPKEVLNEQLDRAIRTLDYQDPYYDEYTEKEEGYYFYCAQNVDGIYVYPREYMDEYNPRFCDFPNFTVYVTRDGVASVMMNEVYAFAQSENKLTLCDFSKIVDTARAHYEQVATEEITLEVTRFELLYFPLKVEGGQYRLVPIWAVTAEWDWRTGENGNTEKYIIAINAQTGEEMPELFYY